MARSYYLGSANSDLSGGADFSKSLPYEQEGAGSINVSVANSATETSYAWTDAGQPNLSTFTSGTITVKVNVTTGSSSILLAVQLQRVNSSGTVQQSQTISSEQTLTAGVKTYTFSSLTWSAGSSTDRLRVLYQFRSTNSHGGAASVTIETGTSNTEIATPFPAIVGTVRAVGQYASDAKTPIAVGGATGTDGITNPVFLEGEYTSGITTDSITPKFEVKATGTSFSNSATITNRARVQNNTTGNFISRRGGAMVWDKSNDRYIYFGGYDGTTRYNDVWELPMDRPGQAWRQLSPSGTPPSGRNLAGSTYVQGNLTSGGALRSYMIIWGGNDPNDKQDMFSLRLDTPGSEAWTTITQTNTPLARGYITNAMTSAPVTGASDQNYIYLIGGWGSARYSDIQRCTFDVDTPTSVTWTQRVASGTISVRSGVVADYNSNNGKIYFFGGYTGSSYLTDFYEWDDSGSGTLTQITVTGTAPAGREMGSGGYDPTNNRFWYAGGWTGTTGASTRNDIGYITNVSSGTRAWVEKRANDNGSTGNHQYPPHALAPSIIDTNRRILFEKGMFTYDSTERYGFAIDLDDASSSNMPVYGLLESEYMKGRDAPGMLYNPDASEFLMIGGFDDIYDESTIAAGGHTSDVWVYSASSNTWRWAATGYLGLPPTEGRNAAYDTSRQRILLFGGLSGVSQEGNEVWTLTRDANGNYKAARLNPTGTPPSPRWFSAMAYDATLDRLIVALGGDGSGTTGGVYSLSFTGSADGAWTTLSPSGSVTDVAGMAYINDSANKKMYILGGATNSALSTTNSQVRSFDYSTTNGAWSSALTTLNTPTRTPAFGFDSANGKIIIFGGFDGSNPLNLIQIYDIAGNSMSAGTPGTSPDPRRSGAGAYFNSKFYTSSGRPNSGTWYKDTWELTPNYSTVSSSTWSNKAPKVYNPMYGRYTGGTNGTSYHWQEWYTESSTDTSLVSFGGNAESAADFTIGSGGPAQYTKTHTTDALKRKQSTKTHTTDANKKVSGTTKTHTTDALKRKQFTKSHTTDANKKKSGVTVSHTTDANKKKSGLTRTHTTDANKRKTGVTVTHTTDSLIRNQFTKTHTTDANKRKATTKSHTTDANTRKQTVKTHTTDANKRKSGITVSHTTDSLKRKQTAVSHTTDSNKKKTTSVSHSTDAFKTGPDRYWVGGSGTWGDTAHWSYISGGSGGATVPTYTENVIFDANSFSSDGSTVDATGDTIDVKSFDSSAIDQTFTLQGEDYYMTVHGNVIFSSSMSLTNLGLWAIAEDDNQYTIDTKGIPFQHNHIRIDQNATTGSFILQSDLYQEGTGSEFYTWIRSAVLDMNGYDLNVNNLYADGGQLVGSGTITINDRFGQWDTGPVESGLDIVYNGSNLSGFGGWGYLDFGNNLTDVNSITIQSTSGLSGVEFYNSITAATWSFEPDTNITFDSASTYTGSTWNFNGTSGHVVTMNRWNVSGQFTFSDSSGTNTGNYLTISNNIATGGASWLRGTGFTGTNVSGWKQTLTISHTTDALKRKQATLTHTTDSNKRKAYTVSHSTDANKRRQYTQTHTTDALLRKRLTLSHTTDALKRKFFSLSHTTDSLKRKSNTVTHTTDSLKRKQFTVGHNTDANLRKVTTTSHTTDANKKKANNTVTHTTDSLKRTRNTLSHTTDAYLTPALVTYTITHTTDALKRKQSTLSHTTDSNKKKANNTVTHTTDANKKKSNLVLTHTTDALLRAIKTVSHTTDALKRTLNTLSHTTDSLLRKANTLSHTTDSNKRRVTLVSHTTDANKRKAYTVAHSTDANKKKANNIVSHTTDALKRTVNTLSHTTDALLRKRLTLTHTTDSFLRGSNVVTHTTDANKRRAYTVSHTTDSNKKRAYTVSHTTDSNKKKANNTVSHTTDALKRTRNTLSHTTDALKRTITAVVHTTDALLRRRLTLSHTTDSNKRKAQTVSHTTDSNKRRAYTVSHSTDANKKKADITVSHTTDALLRSANTLQHTTDSNLKKSFTVSHNTDALFYSATSRSHNTDANKRKATTVSHTTDANKKRAAITIFHTTDAFLRRRLTLTHTTDSNKRKATTVSHTTDSLKRARTVVSHTTDSNKRKVFTVNHLTDALKRAVNTLVHSTDSLLRKANTVSHSTDANKKKAGNTVFHTTDAYRRGANQVQHTTDANKRKAGLTVFHTTDALKKRRLTVSHLTDALKRKANQLSHTTDSLLRKVFSKLHLTDALKRKANTTSHTTDSALRTQNTVSHTTDATTTTRHTVQHSTDANKRKVSSVYHTTDTNKSAPNLVSHTTDAFINGAPLTSVHVTLETEDQSFVLESDTTQYVVLESMDQNVIIRVED